MKTKQLFLSLLFLGTGTFAQEVNYYFEQFTHNYTDLSNPTSVNNGEVWDDPDYTVPIGFDFKLFNYTMSNLFFNDDFGGIVYNEEINYAIVVTGADIADRGENSDGQSTSPISYQIDDSGNSKIFKLEWKNAGFLDDDDNNYYMNLQLWIYEGSNMIEIHYGLSNVPDNFYNWEFDFCGLLEIDWNTETAEGYVLEEGTEGYQFGFSYLDGFAQPNTFNSVPENGTVFRIYPEYAISMDELESVIQIHPNPTTDVLYIENDEQVFTKYQIVSLDGRILKTGTSSEQKIQIDLSDLNTGMYFVRGTKNGNNFTKTISKI